MRNKGILDLVGDFPATGITGLVTFVIGLLLVLGDMSDAIDLLGFIQTINPTSIQSLIDHAIGYTIIIAGSTISGLIIGFVIDMVIKTSSGFDRAVGGL